MKRRKPETAKQDREYNAWVKVQLEKHNRCVVFPYKFCRIVHHIARGVHRRSALMEPCATVTVSLEGHDVIEGWPIEKQLAAKLCASPEQAAEVDLPRFNEIRGRAPNAITIADIAPYLELKR